MTEFGGAVAVPSAVRSNDNTTTMRVNDVIMIRIDGAIDRTVSSAISWIARSVTPPPFWPPRLMLMSCAHAGTASKLAVRTVLKNKTLRGGLAALTKDSSGGRAARPFRLPDCQSRSWAPDLRVGPAVVRCAESGGRSAVPARPAAQRRHRQAAEARLPAAAPSRRDSGPPKPSAAASVVVRAVLRAAPRAAAPSAHRPAPAASGAASSVRIAAWHFAARHGLAARHARRGGRYDGFGTAAHRWFRRETGERIGRALDARGAARFVGEGRALRPRRRLGHLRLGVIERLAACGFAITPAGRVR